MNLNLSFPVSLNLDLANGKRFTRSNFPLPIPPVIGMEIWIVERSLPSHLKCKVKRIIAEVDENDKHWTCVVLEALNDDGSFGEHLNPSIWNEGND